MATNDRDPTPIAGEPRTGRSARRLPPQLESRRKYSFEFPPALRSAISDRAGAAGVTTSVMVTKALEWYVDRWYADGQVPSLRLLDPSSLPNVPTAFPRLYTIGVATDVMAPIDTIAASEGPAGSTRSDVLRHALCAYLEHVALNARHPD